MVHKSTVYLPSAGGVTTINGLAGAITLTSSNGSITITPAGSTINLTTTGTAPGGSTLQVQYNNAGIFGGIAGSVVGTGLSSGSVAFSRISAGTATPISGLSDTYGFIDGGFIVREHGINAQSLNLGSGGTSGTYSLGNLSGQGTGGFISFNTGNSILTGGNGDVNILTNNGAQILMSGTDGSVLMTNQVTGAFIIVDGGGGATLRSQGDGGGIYADPSENTYVGWYSSGFHMTVANDGSVVWGETAAPSTIMRIGPDFGTGGFWIFNAANYGSQAFFDILSGSSSNSCSIRVFTDTQCGEFAAVANSGEYFSNSTSGDTALKGDPGGANHFLIGVGSGNSQLIVGSSGVGVTNLTAGRVTFAGTSGYLTDNAGLTYVSGSGLKLNTVGEGYYCKEGTNARMGVATLVAGTVTVSTNKVTANSRIFITVQSPGGTPGFTYINTRTAGTSFVIKSSNVSDTSIVAWIIVEPS